MNRLKIPIHFLTLLLSLQLRNESVKNTVLDELIQTVNTVDVIDSSKLIK